MTAPLKHLCSVPERTPVAVKTAKDPPEVVNWPWLASHRRVTGEVMVITGQFRSHAVCSCGWDGGARLWRAMAFYDAHAHAADCRCQLAFPLVVVTKRYA